MKSTGSPPAPASSVIASSSRPVVRVMAGSSPLVRLGVNTADIRERIRLWFGGLASRIDRDMTARESWSALSGKRSTVRS